MQTELISCCSNPLYIFQHFPAFFLVFYSCPCLHNFCCVITRMVESCENDKLDVCVIHKLHNETFKKKCMFDLRYVLTFMQGSARRLVKVALQEAAKKREMRYSDLKKIDRGVRRHFHDDITVIVVFLDANLVSRASSVKCSNISLKGGGISLPPNTLAPCTTPTEAGNT